MKGLPTTSDVWESGYLQAAKNLKFLWKFNPLEQLTITNPPTATPSPLNHKEIIPLLEAGKLLNHGKWNPSIWLHFIIILHVFNRLGNRSCIKMQPQRNCNIMSKSKLDDSVHIRRYIRVIQWNPSENPNSRIFYNSAQLLWPLTLNL